MIHAQFVKLGMDADVALLVFQKFINNRFFHGLGIKLIVLQFFYLGDVRTVSIFLGGITLRPIRVKSKGC
jgi:hypothetical protein